MQKRSLNTGKVQILSSNFTIHLSKLKFECAPDSDFDLISRFFFSKDCHSNKKILRRRLHGRDNKDHALFGHERGTSG